MKKIIVPEEMLQTAIKESSAQTTGQQNFVRDGLEAALLWLSENPIVPSDEQASEIWKIALEKAPKINKSNGETLHLAAKNLAVAWGAIMFLPPGQEKEAVDEEKERFRVALEKLAKLGNGDAYGNSQGNEIAQEALGMDKRSPKPAAEQDSYHPDPIIETMNRRMAEYSDWVHRNLYNLFEKTPLEPRLPWDKPGRKVFTYADVVKAGSK